MPWKKSAFEVIASARKTAKPETNVAAPRPVRTSTSTTVTTPETSASSLSGSPLPTHSRSNTKPNLTKTQAPISECRPDTIPKSRNLGDEPAATSSISTRATAVLSDRKAVKSTPVQVPKSENAPRPSISATTQPTRVKSPTSPSAVAMSLPQPVRTSGTSARRGASELVASSRQVTVIKPTPAREKILVESSKLPSREKSVTKQPPQIESLASLPVVTASESQPRRTSSASVRKGAPDLISSSRQVVVIKPNPTREKPLVESSKLPSREIDKVPLPVLRNTVVPQTTDKIGNTTLHTRPAKQPQPEGQISSTSSGTAPLSQQPRMFRPLSENEATQTVQRMPIIGPTDAIKIKIREQSKHRSAFERISPAKPIVSSPPPSETVMSSLSSEPSPYCSVEMTVSPGKKKAIPKYLELPKSEHVVFDASSPEALAAMSAAYTFDLTQMQSPPKPTYLHQSTKRKDPTPQKSNKQTFATSSQDALATMAAAFAHDQAFTLPPKSNAEKNDQFSRYPEKPKYTSYDDDIPSKRYNHRVVDLGSLHGNKFSAFVVCAVCEILHFLYTSKPSTHLRLINLVLAVSLYSGVFDTHVQRAPLGMMLNRLAAWILALLALSTSVYTSPEAKWQVGETRLLNMVGTFVFPLALLDSINVLRAEIRCRNFILKGFVVECLYVYCFILGVPIARLLLADDAAASLCERYPLPETMYIVSIFSALVVAIEYFFVCQVAAGNFSKEFWQGMTSILWGFIHAPGCAFLVGKLNGLKAGGYVYAASFVIFLIGRLFEPLLEETGWLRYRETSTSPPTKKLD
ncbi:hypothetical protein MHU86_8341 [Fragilaria crotonensis]|nr:hypothetical protein MHU86_8341 [Fragilaria crotonensis]